MSVTQNQSRSSGSAFIVEILILLLFVVAAMAIFMEMLSNSKLISQESQKLTNAIHLASNASEQFSANPTSSQGSITLESLTVSTNVKSEKWTEGTMYHATIVVSDNINQEIYRLSNDKYVSNNRTKDSIASNTDVPEDKQSSDNVQDSSSPNNESASAEETLSLDDQLSPSHNPSGDAYAL